MRRCPKCQSVCVHHRGATTPLQKLRQRVTRQARYRCATCGWTGWGHDYPFRAPASPTPVRGDRSSDPDLTKLDDALEAARAARKHTPKSK